MRIIKNLANILQELNYKICIVFCKINNNTYPSRKRDKKALEANLRVHCGNLPSHVPSLQVIELVPVSLWFSLQRKLRVEVCLYCLRIRGRMPPFLGDPGSLHGAKKTPRWNPVSLLLFDML